VYDRFRKDVYSIVVRNRLTRSIMSLGRRPFFFFFKQKPIGYRTIARELLCVGTRESLLLSLSTYSLLSLQFGCPNVLIVLDQQRKKCNKEKK